MKTYYGIKFKPTNELLHFTQQTTNQYYNQQNYEWIITPHTTSGSTVWLTQNQTFATFILKHGGHGSIELPFLNYEDYNIDDFEIVSINLEMGS